MKKIICVLLSLITFISLPLNVFASVDNENSFEILDPKVTKTSTVRTRKKVDGLRMYVDKDNPLFLFRNVDNGKTVWESALDTYNAIPEDIRNFSAIYIDYHWDFDKEEQTAFWEKYLTFTDKHNVPTICQVENYCTNGTREGFTTEELTALFQKHPSLIGFNQVELCTSGVSRTNKATERIYQRLKDCIRACIDNGGLFVWQEMEYVWWEKRCYVNHMLDDKELYDLVTSSPQNIIIMDKHNGRGRHFSSQSNIMGAWLAGACGNWGVNLENFIWYEEAYTDYNDSSMSTEHPSYKYSIKYPPALLGTDLIADMVGGATVYGFEGTYFNNAVHTCDSEGNIIFTDTFYDVLYPLYQKILASAVPSKEEVKEKVKVAYRFTSPVTYPLSGTEAHLIQGLYADKITLWQEKFVEPYTDLSKSWVPSTGRYYIIPILPQRADVKSVLPDAFIMDDFQFFARGLFIDPLKKLFFNNRYEETYTGNGVLYDIADNIYIFNSNENKTVDAVQSASYTMKSGKKLDAVFDAHTYAIINEDNGKISVDLCNLRLDIDEADILEKNEYQFLQEYITEGKVGDPENYRTTTLSFSGFKSEPDVTATGSHFAKMKKSYNSSTGTLTLTIISNGEVLISIK